MVDYVSPYICIMYMLPARYDDDDVAIQQSEFLSKQVMHEDTQYFSCKRRKDQFLPQTMKD